MPNLHAQAIVFQWIKVYWNRVDDEWIDEWIIDDG